MLRFQMDLSSQKKISLKNDMNFSLVIRCECSMKKVLWQRRLQ